ncbi:hypothetical protein ANN_22292 [Periplaneta americana]|uniref:Uncharacterized protein n=1 Tax=Periplaneta americana TaxID=6978 RepID=A0ABQ8S7Z2_PERAM|nr:hypothetical protein ANN_22292 [Periplaneta americana]
MPSAWAGIEQGQRYTKVIWDTKRSQTPFCRRTRYDKPVDTTTESSVHAIASRKKKLLRRVCRTWNVDPPGHKTILKWDTTLPETGSLLPQTGKHQDGAPPHYHQRMREFLDEKFPIGGSEDEDPLPGHPGHLI